MPPTINPGRNFTFRLAAILLLAFVGTSPSFAQGDPPRDPEVVRERLDELRARMGRVQREIAAQTRREDSLAAELSEAERRLNRIAAALREVDAELSAARVRLEELESERTRLHEALDEQRGALASSVRSAFLMGREQRLKLLLNQRDLSAAGRVMAYYRYLHRARVDRIRGVEENLRRLRTVESAIADRRDELESLRSRRAGELAREKQAQERRREVLAGIRARIESRGEALAALQRDEQALEELLRSIEEALADIPSQVEEPFGRLKGRLAWPLPGIRSVHAEDNGVLIGADSGTSVHVVAAGRVAYADWLRGYGLLVIVDHGDGYMSLYAHNHSLYKEVGDWVGAGAPIGEVGASGGREQPGLYFELRRNGEPIPALAWLAGR